MAFAPLNQEQMQELFRDFKDRDKYLHLVTRYSMYDVMLYRTNLYTHSHRTAAIVRAINPTALTILSGYDPRKAELLALVHDDAEIIFGDVQAGNKSKMTPKQLLEVQRQEARAIKKIAEQFPKYIDRYVYERLLEEAADHSSLEAQVVSYADKYDALGEAYHEAFAGNYYFVTNVVNEYGKIPTPFEYYESYFGTFLDKFPALAPLLSARHPIFVPVQTQGCQSVVVNAVPHTDASLRKTTGQHHYDVWKQIILSDTNPEVVDNMIRIKEQLPIRS